MKVYQVDSFTDEKFKGNPAAEDFLKNLNDLAAIDYEIVSLSNYNLEICRGCKLCTDKGEEYCPLKDEREILIEKINPPADTKKKINPSRYTR